VAAHSVTRAKAVEHSGTDLQVRPYDVVLVAIVLFIIAAE